MDKILRKECVDVYRAANQFDIYVTTFATLGSHEAAKLAIGSMAYVREKGKVYIKMTNNGNAEDWSVA